MNYRGAFNLIECTSVIVIPSLFLTDSLKYRINLLVL